jgi:hypothetical protein
MNIFSEEAINEFLVNNPYLSSKWIACAKDLVINSKYNIDDLLYKYNTEQLEILKKITNDEKYNSIVHISDIEERNKFILETFYSGLNATQMELLYTAVINGLDFNKACSIVKPDIPYVKLNYILQAMIDGYDLTEYINYETDQLYEIFAGTQTKIDYKIYANKDISAESMGVIRHALEVGMNVIINIDNTITIKK